MAKDRIEEQLRSAWLEWKKNPTKETTQKMLDTAKPVLDRIISGFFGPSYVNDRLLRGRAELHLIKSLQNYDITKGSLTNFIWINMQRLQRYLGRQQSTLRLSEKAIMTINEMNRVEKDLEEKLGRPPTTEELADAMKQSVDKIEKLRMYRSIGYESSFEAGTDESGGWLPAVKKEDETMTKEFLNVVYDYISDPKHKIIMEYAYGLKGRPKMGVTEIAKKIDVSPAYVSKALKNIQEHYQNMVDYWKRIELTSSNDNLKSLLTS